MWNIYASQKRKEMKAKKRSEEYTLSVGKAAAMKVDNYSNSTPGSQKSSSFVEGINSITVS